MNPPRIVEAPAGERRRRIPRIPPLAIAPVAALAVGLGAGYAAGWHRHQPPAPIAPHQTVVLPGDEAPRGPDLDSLDAARPQPPLPFELQVARRVLGERVVDAVMYIDPPAQRHIVALRTENYPDTSDRHGYEVYLLSERGGRYVPQKLALRVETEWGNAIGKTPFASPSSNAEWRGMDTDRLWGIDDVDGDGLADVWAAQQHIHDNGNWELHVQAWRAATGKVETVLGQGETDTDQMPQPQEGWPIDATGPTREWLHRELVLLAAPLYGRSDEWKAKRAADDAVAIYVKRHGNARPGPVPRVEVRYVPWNDPLEVYVQKCERGPLRFVSSETAVWRDERSRGRRYPVYVGDSRVMSVAIGRRYLWLAVDADERGRPPARILAYDPRGERLLSATVPDPAPELCTAGHCSVEDARFTLRGDTLFLGSRPFHAPPALGGPAETRGATACTFEKDAVTGR